MTKEDLMEIFGVTNPNNIVEIAKWTERVILEKQESCPSGSPCSSLDSLESYVKSESDPNQK